MKIALLALWVVPILSSAAGCAHARDAHVPPLLDTEKRQATRLMALAEVPESRLDLVNRRRLVRIVGERRCPCPGARGSLSECAVERGGCVRAPFAVRRVARGLARGEREQAIIAALLSRFGPREPEQIDVAHAPCRGPEEAPVTLVVFSDFQCPFCSMGARLVDRLGQVAGNRLRVCFKHFPLTSIHEHARLAAQAAVAAGAQGKFWPMHDRLFENQKDLERDDLVDHAEALGLDVERFRRDLDSDATRARVVSDARQALSLRLGGTPAFLINGRRMTDPKTIPDFLDWIAEAVALSRQPGGPE